MRSPLSASVPCCVVALAGAGIDWPSVGIGAALFGGLVIAGFGIATVRRARPRETDDEDQRTGSGRRARARAARTARDRVSTS